LSRIGRAKCAKAPSVSVERQALGAFSFCRRSTLSDSALSSYTSKPAFEAGLAFAARQRAFRDDQVQQENQQQALAERERESSKRALQNEMSIIEYRSRLEAEKAKQMAPLEWRQAHWKEMVDARFKELDNAQKTINENILDPTKWKEDNTPSNETVEAARKKVQQIAEERTNIIGMQPADWSKPLPTTQFPRFDATIPFSLSPESQKVREEKVQHESLQNDVLKGNLELMPLRKKQLQTSIARGNQSIANMRNGGGLTKLDPLTKAQIRDLGSGLGAYNEFLSSSPIMQKQTMVTPSGQRYESGIMGPDFAGKFGQNPKAIEYNQKYALKAPGMMRALSNPRALQALGFQPDISDYVSKHAAKHNYLRTGPDLWNFQRVVQEDVANGNPVASDLWNLMNATVPVPQEAPAEVPVQEGEYE
jgi:hypothetical protein